jgi:hypothetical protein
MPDNEESRKSVAGVVTPNATPDADWRREVAGVYIFGEGDVEPQPEVPITNMTMGMGMIM